MEGTISKNRGLVFTEDRTGIVLTLPKEHQAKLKPYIGKGIWLGIRPEHISDAKRSSGASSSRFKAKVEVVEPMGNEIFIYFTTGNGKQYVSRIIATEEPKAGKEMDLAFNMAKAHFFNKETEKVI
jgi:multiple sugar transport system ATP-binding protein